MLLTESSDQCRPASATFGHTNAHSPAMTTRSAFSLADRPPSRGKAPPEALFLSGTLTSGRQEQPGVGCMQDRTSASYPTGAQIISQARPLSQPAVETNNSSNVTLSRPAFTTVPPASALAVPSKQPLVSTAPHTPSALSSPKSADTVFTAAESGSGSVLGNSGAGEQASRDPDASQNESTILFERRPPSRYGTIMRRAIVWPECVLTRVDCWQAEAPP
jgi:hypothetical protein